MRASIEQLKNELRFYLSVNEQPVGRDMALALADMSPDKFMVAATCGQRLPHRQQSNDLVQLRHVQAPLNGEFIGAFELRSSGDEVHCHGFTNLDLREAPQRK